MNLAIQVEDIDAAAERLQGQALETPILENWALNQRAGGRVLIKAESLQHVGAFKFRGAYNCLVQLNEAQRKAGVVAWSSGNHAQGVAAAAQRLGIDATIVMPKDAPSIKVEKTRAYGAEVRFYDRYLEDREAVAKSLCEERGAVLVPSYDDANIIAGQGTVGLEIFKQSQGLDLACVLSPSGGGGLSAGSAMALRSRLPHLSFYGVEPEAYNDTQMSLAAGKRCNVDQQAKSICDSLMAPSPGQLTFPIMQEYFSGVLTVSDEEVKAAVYFAWKELKLVVEPGGAVALAALLAGKYSAEGKTIAIILSGGNVDPVWFSELLAEHAA